MDKITRRSLIEKAGAMGGVTFSEAEKVIQALENIICSTLARGGEVNWYGLGKFSVTTNKKSLRRNPRTGKLVDVPEHKRAKLVVGEKLKKAVLNH
jgi:DNA-binding protein HU-beta